MHSFLSLGRIHLPVYGLFAAAGLICAMALGLRTAPLARVNRDDLWDAEMFTVLCAFGLTRALLVVENLHAFLRYPILVLELPSLTLPGVVLTMVAAGIYLRRRKLPLLPTLDAVAPGAALLWSILNLGRLADGTREGMITSVPWAVTSSFGHVHPVELYTAVAYFLLCAVLLWILRGSNASGETGAWGMVLGALLQFLLCFFRLPQVLYSKTLVDGSQWRAVYLMVVGGLLLAWAVGFGARTAPAAASDLKDASDAV